MSGWVDGRRVQSIDRPVEPQQNEEPCRCRNRTVWSWPVNIPAVRPATLSLVERRLFGLPVHHCIQPNSEHARQSSPVSAASSRTLDQLAQYATTTPRCGLVYILRSMRMCALLGESHTAAAGLSGWRVGAIKHTR